MKKGRWSLRTIIIVFVCAVVAFSLLVTDILITEFNERESPFL